MLLFQVEPESKWEIKTQLSNLISPKNSIVAINKISHQMSMTSEALDPTVIHDWPACSTLHGDLQSNTSKW